MTDKITTIKPEGKFTREFVYTLMKLTKKEQMAVRAAFSVWEDTEYWGGINKHNIASVVDTWVKKFRKFEGKGVYD